MKKVIELNNINKSFDYKKVMKDVSLTFNEGKIYGLIGKNGAGKSTLLKIIASLAIPNSGEIKVFNEVVNSKNTEYLRNVGVLIEEPIFYERLTVRENLKLQCSYFGFYNEDRIDEVIEELGLSEYKDKKATKLPMGIKQCVAIARAIVTKPKILLLDEPINALDPIKIMKVREILVKLNEEEGVTIIMASHILKELEAIVTDLIFINEGAVCEEVTLKELKDRCGEFIEIRLENVSKATVVLERDLGIRNYTIINENIIRVNNVLVSSKEIFKKLMENDVEVIEVKNQSKSLEEYYFELVGGM